MLAEFNDLPRGSTELSQEQIDALLAAADDLAILRMDNESDADYAARVLKMLKAGADISRLFDDGTWQSGSVIDAVSLGLAGIIASHYPSSRIIGPYAAVTLAERVDSYLEAAGEKIDRPKWSDQDIENLIREFRLVDRPTHGDRSEKITYARRVVKALRAIEKALVGSEATDFDAIEALTVELSIILGRSPLDQSICEDLLERIPMNIKAYRERRKQWEDEDEDSEQD